MAGVILLYHRIATDPFDESSLCVEPGVFRRQMELVRAEYCAVTLAELLERRHHSGGADRSIAVTFDDGYTDNLLVASPILEGLTIPATFFVTTACLDRPEPYWWDLLSRSTLSSKQAMRDELLVADLATRNAMINGLRVSPESLATIPRPMSGLELRRLASKRGHAIGAHTVNHLSLPSQTEIVRQNELRESKVSLEQLLDREVASVAYPYGAEDAAIARTAGNLGFQFGLTVRSGVVTAESDLLRLPRVQVSATTDLEAELEDLFSQTL